MKKKLLKWAIALLLLAVAGFLSVKYIPRTDWYRNFTSKKGGKISATELVKIYQENPAKADSLYTEKIIEVEGVVASSSIDGESTIVNLSSADAMVSVSVSLKQKREPLKEGAKVSVKGKCNGMLSDVQINEAEIISLQ